MQSREFLKPTEIPSQHSGYGRERCEPWNQWSVKCSLLGTAPKSGSYLSWGHDYLTRSLFKYRCTNCCYTHSCYEITNSTGRFYYTGRESMSLRMEEWRVGNGRCHWAWCGRLCSNPGTRCQQDIQKLTMRGKECMVRPKTDLSPTPKFSIRLSQPRVPSSAFL